MVESTTGKKKRKTETLSKRERFARRKSIKSIESSAASHRKRWHNCGSEIIHKRQNNDDAVLACDSRSTWRIPNDLVYDGGKSKRSRDGWNFSIIYVELNRRKVVLRPMKYQLLLVLRKLETLSLISIWLVFEPHNCFMQVSYCFRWAWVISLMTKQNVQVQNPRNDSKQDEYDFSSCNAFISREKQEQGNLLLYYSATLAFHLHCVGYKSPAWL